jgi:virulence factor Mce-like protein
VADVRPSQILAVLGTVVLLGAGVYIVATQVFGGDEHTLRASFDSAVQVTPGEEVRIAGRKIGQVGASELVDGHAVVDLKIQESDVWPLRRGTTADVRWGSTTSLAYRYIEIKPARAPAPTLPDGAALTLAQTTTPVEFDQAYRIFRGRTRTDLKNVVGELGDTVQGRGGEISSGLKAAPGGLDATAAVLHQLGADGNALTTLVKAGDRVATALAAHSGALGTLVDHAAATFDEFAQHTTAEQRSLDQAPGAFDASTVTLKRLDHSLVGLRALVDDLDPGARALRQLAAPMRSAVSQLYDVAPLATSTLRSGRRASPGLQRLLSKGVNFLPSLSTVLTQLEPMVGCLRPYGPELAGMLGTWAGYNKNFDTVGHYARTFPLLVNPLLTPGTAPDSKTITQVLGSRMTYAMPRPPGLNAGHPWFQPQCGAGPDSLNSSKDPERPGASSK